LEQLNLASTRVADVTPLAGLTNLHSLSLSNTQVKVDDLFQLKAALPRCDVRF
jgi:Leucine-rich repeat (LRR) protein